MGSPFQNFVTDTAALEVDFDELPLGVPFSRGIYTALCQRTAGPLDAAAIDWHRQDRLLATVVPPAVLATALAQHMSSKWLLPQAPYEERNPMSIDLTPWLAASDPRCITAHRRLFVRDEPEAKAVLAHAQGTAETLRVSAELAATALCHPRTKTGDGSAVETGGASTKSVKDQVEGSTAPCQAAPFNALRGLHLLDAYWIPPELASALAVSVTDEADRGASPPPGDEDQQSPSPHPQRGLVSLEAVSLERCTVNSARDVVAALASRTQLKQLHIIVHQPRDPPACDLPISVAESRFMSLSCLTINHVRLTAATMRGISSLPALEVLDVAWVLPQREGYRAPENGEAYLALLPLPRLLALNIAWTRPTHGFFAALAKTSPALADLRANGVSAFDDDVLGVVSKLPLQSLDTAGTNVDDLAVLKTEPVSRTLRWLRVADDRQQSVQALLGRTVTVFRD